MEVPVNRTTAPSLLLIGILLILLSGPANATDFWSHWGDGNAELTGYKLTFPRYGELRQGTAVSIFVTETFSKQKRVKVDQGDTEKADELPVLKHNLVTDFQTGIYDYNLMTSVFASVPAFEGRPPGSLVKVSFSSQEWCGNMYSELIFHAGVINQNILSYFHGESVCDRSMEYPRNGITQDQVPILVRSLFDPIVNPGEEIKVPYLPSAEQMRLKHLKPQWQSATVKRGKRPAKVRVPAGGFVADVWTIAPEKGPSFTYYVHIKYPHVIVKWESSDGQLAEMTGTKRMKYWEMKGGDSEEMLEDVGL